mmetsp:Transcript_35149/g.69007  ORF Transcript_35149/g.69007 Transcript_35149/m.69007 type:complete len:193 (-) Transcript_35149:113-691(-)
MRTVKYLYGLALGVPPITADWVKACVNKREVVCPKEFVLPAGKSAITGQELKFPNHRNLGLRGFMLPLGLSERPFYNKWVAIAGSVEFTQEWAQVLSDAGATLTKEFTKDENEQELSKLFADRQFSLSCILVEPGCDFSKWPVLCSFLQKKKLNMVTPSWVVECLISQKYISVSAHNGFRHHVQWLREPEAE